MSTDAGKPTQNLTPNTLASIQSVEAQIANAASAAGVSALSIAEPIAREENKADVGCGAGVARQGVDPHGGWRHAAGARHGGDDGDQDGEAHRDQLPAVAAPALQARGAKGTMKAATLPIIGAVSWAIASLGHLKAAEQTMSPDEYVNRLPYLHPKPTNDTTPIKIRVGSVIYEIPRNYVKTAVELMPTLWITYPQFQPPTPETHCSSKNQLPVGPSECVIIQLTIHGNIDGLLKYPLPNTVLFQRMTKDNPSTSGPYPGPSGMQIYSQGSAETQNRSEIYKNKDLTTLFRCNFLQDTGQKNGLCIDEITLDDGNAVHVFFNSYLIPHAPDFDEHVRNLVASFKREGVN